MELTRRITVNAPATKVWNILGNNFNDISEWASFVEESHANPDLSAGEKGRVCQVKGAGKVVETIHHYDDENRELAFILQGQKMPFFMRKIDNAWGVKPKGDGESELQVHINITLMPVFSQLLSGRLSKMMGKQAETILSELKYYAENDRPKS